MGFPAIDFRQRPWLKQLLRRQPTKKRPSATAQFDFVVALGLLRLLPGKGRSAKGFGKGKAPTGKGEGKGAFKGKSYSKDQGKPGEGKGTGKAPSAERRHLAKVHTICSIIPCVFPFARQTVKHRKHYLLVLPILPTP